MALTVTPKVNAMKYIGCHLLTSPGMRKNCAFPILCSFGADEKNDEEFAKSLASLGEYLVFDAFSVAHREHASVVGVSKYLPHTLGPIAAKELGMLSKVIDRNNPPFVILGGAKLSSKLPLLETFVKNGCKIFLGGAMAHPIMATRGVDIKNSKTENNINVLKFAENANIFAGIKWLFNHA